MLYQNSTLLLSITLHFQQLILDANILDIAMHYCEDIVLVLNDVQLWNNENIWHAASRQYVLWQHGHMIICYVVAICARWPSPNGLYTAWV